MISIFSGIFIALLALLVGLYSNTFRSTPHVKEDQIRSDGGHALINNDGSVTEYFLVGDEEGIPVVYFHGAGSTGKSCMYMNETARKYRYRVIGISTPGYGASSPIPGRGYFEGARNAVAVLDYLGYKNAQNLMHVMGVSYGSGTAAALAEIIPERIRSLQLVIPAWPSMGNFSIFRNSSTFGLFLNSPFLDRLYAYYIIKANLSLKEIMTKLAPEEVKMAEKVKPGIMETVDKEYKRSTLYHHEGSCELSRMLRSEGSAIYEKMEILKSMKERVSVWIAEKDAAANPGGPKFLKEVLSQAQFFSFQRGHLEMVIYLEDYFDEMNRNDQIN